MTIVPADAMIQLATLRVGTDVYGLDIMQIREIVNPLPVRAVHQAPPFVEGLIELRGAVIPVVDLRKRFGIEATAQTRHTKLVVTNHAGRAVALVVDEVGVLRLPQKAIHEAPAYATQGATTCFSGVVNHDGKMILILKIEAVLGTSEPIVVPSLRAPQ